MKQINKSSTKKPRKKEKWNFKPWLIIGAILAAILALTAVLAYCDGDKPKEVLKFTYSDGEYIDEKNGITYVAAPFCYQAQLTTSKDYPYAASDRQTLYRVGYRDEDDKVHLQMGELWLSTLLEEGAALYYNRDKVTIPDFTEFEGDVIFLCRPDGSLFSTTKIEGAEATELLEAFFTAEGSDYDTLYRSCELISNLKVSSSKYPWLYLNLWLYTDADGNYYLCESTTRKFLKTDAAVFEPFFDETDETGESDES